MNLRPYRLLIVLLVIVVSSIAVSTARAESGGLGSLLTGVTGSDCGTTSTPFLPWLDPNSYYLAPGGDFSAGAAAWSLSGGAQVVSDGPISAASPGGPQLVSSGTSLSLPAGASATSPAVCFGLLNPGIRFFAESDSGSATVHVQVIAVGPLGRLSALDGGTAVVGSSWAPTPTFSTTFSQLDAPLGTQSIEIVITASAPVQIDDVYIDPFCSH